MRKKIFRRIFTLSLSAAIIISGVPTFNIKAASAEVEAGFNSDYDSLTIAGADDIRNDISLIKQAKNGTKIEWTSSNPAVITDSDTDANSIYDGGIVTRPAAGSNPVEVKLTAKLTSKDGSLTKEKVFNVTVAPKTKNLDTKYNAGYFWPHFDASGGYEKIFFGYSTDGLTWVKLNKVNGVVQPVLANDAVGSDKGVRDPHLIRSADGDKYWLIGTDLHAEGGGAGGSGWNQTSASQNIVVWESNDLVNWSEPRIVYSGFDAAGCVWAPEAYYDEVNKDYIVYWSIRDNTKNGTNDNALRVYVCRTRDFNHFSESKVWLSEDPASSTEVNIIDTSIVEDNGKFYRFSTSDWNTIIDVSDTIDTEDVFDVRANENESRPNGSWERIIKRSESRNVGFSSDGVEGLTVYKLPDGRWCAMGDHGGYRAFVTNDLSSGKFTETKATFIDGRFRHGSVIRLSKSEEEALLLAYKEKTIVSDVRDDDGTAGTKEPILEFDFEGDLNNSQMTLSGNAKLVYDEKRDSNVLSLDGSNNTFAELSKGLFDGRNTMTISMDVKSEMSDGNFFTFTFGKDSTAYSFLKIKGSEIRNAYTTDGWQNEKEVKGIGNGTGAWQNVTIVFLNNTMRLYIDGTLVSENNNMGITVSNLGSGIISYLGKSFFAEDSYFKGSFDNFKVYDRALSSKEILESNMMNVNLLKKVIIGTEPAFPAITMGTDYHTAITSKIDKENNIITSYVRKGTKLSSVPVELDLVTSGLSLELNGEPFENGSKANLKKDSTLVISDGTRSEAYTIKKPIISYNPVLPGQYADPDIDYFDGKYWIYPTTDGYPGWGGTVFHAWSSEDLVNWVDEGIILDVANDNPATNDKDIQIAASKWSDGNAWAPSIEEKDGKYYFYYCGNIKGEYSSQYGSGKAIGVAWSDYPDGPFVANDGPIVYPKMMQEANVGFSGQVIDPSIFVDDDGTAYLFFGNGGAWVAELEDDMLSVKAGSIRRINGMRDFRESVVVTKRDGMYHFTWSCDDTGSPNYHVNYGVADSLDGNTVEVSFKYTLLQKDESLDMLGTAHQSILYMPETDECYIAYHRFYTPLGIYTEGLGYHRETCIDKLTFDEEGYMEPLNPTMEGLYYLAKDTEEDDEIITNPISTPIPNPVVNTPSPTTPTIPTKESVLNNNPGIPANGKEESVNSSFAPLFASLKKVTKNSVKIKWKKIADADGYIVLGNKCNTAKKKYAFEVLDIVSGSVTSYKHKGLAKGTSYKYIIQAYKMIDGKLSIITTGKTVYATTSGGKNGNIKALKVNKSKLKLKKGKKFLLKVAVKYKGGKKNVHRKVSYESSDTKVAAVNKKGLITAKRKGSCIIYAYAENGKCKKIKIKLK